MADDGESWVPEFGNPDITEQLEEWESQGLPSPDHWTAYDILIDGDDHARASITADDGFTYSVDVNADLSDLDNWDWMWDLWDWIEAEYPDVDVDADYKED